MTLVLRYAAASHPGLIREHNEDSCRAGRQLLAVADGMGGAAGGEVASRLAITALAPLASDPSDDDPATVLCEAVRDANRRLGEASAAQPELEGMGTTLTALYLSGGRIALAHVGDSRAYRLTESEFTQLTRDDSYVQMLVDRGVITVEEAASHPHRSLVTRVLKGVPEDITCTFWDAVPGERYLVCSDGLNAAVSPAAIEETLREQGDPAVCVDRLIDLALRGGAPDNVTAVIGDVVDEPDDPPRWRPSFPRLIMLLAVLGYGLSSIRH
ncbi:MAG TPA: protein phosphatase 2C domain-containing protein [Micromonosporaceae bacterium]